MLSEKELTELERLNTKRTPGEWHYDGQHNEITTPRGGDYWLIVSECRSAPDQWYPIDEFGHSYDANFAFIAACSRDVPKMLETIEALRKALPSADELRKEAAYLKWGEKEPTTQAKLLAWATRIEAMTEEPTEEEKDAD